MKHHEDPFFDSVRNELYAMEVAPPAAVQAKVMSRVRSSRPVWVLNSLAAVVLCTAAIGAVSWNYYTADSDARKARVVEPQLDAALSTAQARIVEREEVIDAKPAAPATVRELPRAPQAQISAPKALPKQEPVLELTEVALRQGTDNDLPRCPELPETVATELPLESTLPAATAMSAADILKQAQSQNDSVIRMSVKVTIPVNGKE